MTIRQNHPSFFYLFVFLFACLCSKSLSFQISSTANCRRCVSLTPMLLAASGSTDMPTIEQFDQVLQVAIQAAKSAGKIIMKNAEGSDVVEKKASSRDLLTLIDPLCEQVRTGSCMLDGKGSTLSLGRRTMSQLCSSISCMSFLVSLSRPFVRQCWKTSRITISWEKNL
jgi:hypothetical protein